MERKLYSILKASKVHLSAQQYKTIKGQIRSGDYDGATKGLNTIKERNFKVSKKRKEVLNAR